MCFSDGHDSNCAFLTDCHDSTCTFLIVMLILTRAFIVLMFIRVCVKCFNTDVRIYSTRASSSSFGLFVCLFVSCWLFVMLILINAFIVLALFDCQVDVDVDNVQRRDVFTGYSAI